jgi:hypothetical protein
MEAAVTFYLAEIGRLAEARAGLETLAACWVRGNSGRDLRAAAAIPRGHHPRVQHRGRPAEMILGYLAAALGRYDEAEGCLTAATKVHELIGAHLFLSRAPLPR